MFLMEKLVKILVTVYFSIEKIHFAKYFEKTAPTLEEFMFRIYLIYSWLWYKYKW